MASLAPGSLDPSRPSPAIHFDDPVKDRKDGAKQEWLCPPILIALEHQASFLSQELSLRDRWRALCVGGLFHALLGGGRDITIVVGKRTDRKRGDFAVVLAEKRQ